MTQSIKKLAAKVAELEKKESLMEAAHYCEMLLSIAQEIGEMPKYKSYKAKLRNLNQKASEQFQNFEHKYKFSKKEIEAIEKVKEEILNNHSNFEDCLIGISQLCTIIPSFDLVKEEAIKNMGITRRLCSNSVYDDKGNLVKGGDDSEKSWTMQIYGWHIKFMFETFFLPILWDLKNKDTKISQKIITYFTFKKVFPNDVLLKVKKGIQAYFKKDYISSSHILIPTFESAFLNISEGLGIDIVKVSSPHKKKGETKISTKTQTLSSHHLESKEFQERWGRDFCKQVNYMLFEDLGYRFRHKIAHGEIRPEECFFASTISVYLLLVIARKVKRSK